MSAQPSYIEQSNNLRCFDVNIDPRTVMPAWFIDWRKGFLSGGSKLSHRHEEALARLIPLLLCGEQSAIHVFGVEVERLRGSPWSSSISLLKDIETDEYAHEQALQTLASMLMEPTDLRSIKRKARHFYISLGTTAGMGEHFARISQLDSCVCIIMNAITQCDLGRTHLIVQLFDHIKKDEARHVSISRKHFLKLGGDRRLFKESNKSIGSKLVTLLATQQDSFEALGIDPDVLFQKLARI
ncbi:MAG: hypothetical protein ACI85N_001725 [Gammaproteobacteria bacterium]|jgi:hypothetical protein